jgi:hypothetical protein
MSDDAGAQANALHDITLRDQPVLILRQSLNAHVREVTLTGQAVRCNLMTANVEHMGIVRLTLAIGAEDKTELQPHRAIILQLEPDFRFKRSAHVLHWLALVVCRESIETDAHLTQNAKLA